MAAVLGFGYQLELNRMGKNYLYDVLSWLQRQATSNRDFILTLKAVDRKHPSLAQGLVFGSVRHRDQGGWNSPQERGSPVILLAAYDFPLLAK